MSTIPASSVVVVGSGVTMGENRNAQTADLRRHMEEASGEDLEQFFHQWLFQGGIPELRGSWTQRGGELVITIEQVQESYDYDLDVDFLVELTDGSTTTITVGASTTPI